ncbi:MAG: hypothetical protein WC679_11040 [Bacteroidales bacterium]|jgi:hypothetical protein
MKKFKLVSGLLIISLLLLVLSCQKGNNVSKTSIDNIVKEEDNFKYDSVDLKLYEPKKELYSILDSVIADSYVDNGKISSKKLVYLFDVINDGYEEDLSITHTEICEFKMSYFKACFTYKDNVFLYMGKFDSNLVYDNSKKINYKYVVCEDEGYLSKSWTYKYINNKLTLTITSNDVPKESNFEFKYW